MSSSLNESSVLSVGIRDTATLLRVSIPARGVAGEAGSLD